MFIKSKKNFPHQSFSFINNQVLSQIQSYIKVVGKLLNNSKLTFYAIQSARQYLIQDICYLIKENFQKIVNGQNFRKQLQLIHEQLLIYRQQCFDHQISNFLIQRQKLKQRINSANKNDQQNFQKLIENICKRILQAFNNITAIQIQQQQKQINNNRQIRVKQSVVISKFNNNNISQQEPLKKIFPNYKYQQSNFFVNKIQNPPSKKTKDSQLKIKNIMYKKSPIINQLKQQVYLNSNNQIKLTKQSQLITNYNIILQKQKHKNIGLKNYKKVDKVGIVQIERAKSADINSNRRFISFKMTEYD